MFVPMWALIIGGLVCFVVGILLATIDEVVWLCKRIRDA